MAGRGGTSGEPQPPPPEARLILLATVHGDPSGYDRAWRFFEYFRPEVLTVEISPYSVRYRERAGRGWQRRLAAGLQELPPGADGRLALARVAAQAALPFEYRVARDWGRTYGVPVKLLDTGRLARRHLPRYREELFSPENLRVLWATGTEGSLQDFVAGEFRRARLALKGQGRRLPPLHPQEAICRERLWAKRLRRLMVNGPLLMHLGGWEHLAPWPERGGWPHLLADLKPVFLLLDEAEQLQSEGGPEFRRPQLTSPA